jgi:hypothetical protein
MAASSKETGDDSRMFQDVFTDGPLEEITTRCDAITATSLLGSSKLHLYSAKHSETLHASLPFGLPCVLHSHVTKISWHCNEYLEGKGTTCRLMLLDRFSSDAVMPTSLSFGKNWAGANGDWIASVAFGGKWELVNMYTHYKISLPSVSSLEATTDPFTFMHYGRPIRLQKIAIC